MNGSVTLAADFVAATWIFLFVAIILIVANQVTTIIKNIRAARGDIPDDDYIITRKDLEGIEKCILKMNLAIDGVDDSIQDLIAAIYHNNIDGSYDSNGIDFEESDEQTETEGKI